MTNHNPYDRFLYPSRAYSSTHPSHLAAIAHLFGLAAAPAQQCRVLELGCGSGGNLIAMAVSLPESSFSGIDLAGLPITQGQEMIRAMGLANITLEQKDIMTVGPEIGQFNYIIVHGLYAWVPPPVQEKILSLCKALLAPLGLAYVSYNAYPGCHLRVMAAEMMRYHVAGVPEPRDKVEKAISLITFLSRSATKEPYKAVLVDALKELTGRPAESIFHDELSPANQPLYFSTFMASAMDKGLQYLAEAHFHEMHDAFPSEVTSALDELAGGDVIAKEQYLDFLKGRRFRRTLLCHDTITLSRPPRPELVHTLYAASAAQPVTTGIAIASTDEMEFAHPQGATMKTGHPLAKAVLQELARAWPISLSFSDLLDRARSQLQDSDFVQPLASAGEDLGKILLWAFATGVIVLESSPPGLTPTAGERPLASPLARLQLAAGRQVTNLRHMTIDIDNDLIGLFVTLLDGTRDRPTLVSALADHVAAGAATLKIDGQPVHDREQMMTVLAREVEEGLKQLARFGLLVR